MNANDAPKKPENRPGLPEIAYRITDYTASRQRLLNRLRDSLRPEEVGRDGPLVKLTTRDNDDIAIALLDACSVVSDVLTFHQERIINEGYLRTSTERRSVLELARMIGYELDPGVAASTYFAFTVEDAPGSPETATIPKGTQVMSVPGEDELPQTFETSEEFVAHVDWNNLKPRLSRPQQITKDTTQLYIKGVNTRLQPGDFLLFVEQLDKLNTGRKYLLHLTKVETNANADWTLVCTEKLLLVDSSSPESSNSFQNPQLFAFRQKAFLYGHNAPDQLPAATVVLASSPTRYEIVSIDWYGRQPSNPQPTDTTDADKMDLDAPYPQIVKGSWVVVYENTALNSSIQKAYKVKETAIISRLNSIAPITDPASNLAQFSEITRLAVEPDRETNLNARSKVVLAQSELLELVPEPLIVSDRQTNIFQDPLQAKTVFLNEFVQKLHRDQILIVSGQRMRAQLNDLGGAFHSVLGMPNDVQLLVAKDETLFVGKADGVFQLQTDEWGKIGDITGVQALAVKDDTVFAGTADGVFQLQADEWGKIGDITEVRALAVKEDTIFAGTADGVFQLQADEWGKIGDITEVRALAVKEDTIFAGTADGVFQLQADAWKDINTGLTKFNVQALVVKDGTLFAHTADGFFQWVTSNSEKKWQRVGSVLWNRSNAGFTNTQIRALIRSSPETSLLAGTTEGLFRSTNNGQHWEPIVGWETISKTLESKEIQTLQIKKLERTENTLIFVGTASGLFRSDDKGETWQKLAVGLTDIDLRVIDFYPNNQILVGTINGGIFRSSDNGMNWGPTGLNNVDVQSLTSHLNANATPTLYTFAGTIRDGIFRSTDAELLTWQQITETRQGIGTITTNGAGVISQDTRFSTQLKPGDVINAEEQSRIVLEITTDPNDSIKENLTVDHPFRPDLSTSTTFTINTGLTSRNITALVALETTTLGTNKTFVFAGTAGNGVFRSDTENATRTLGDRWTAVNAGLTDLEIRCLAIDQDKNIWVGTSKEGVFRSTNNGESWEPVNTHLTNLDVRAILPPKENSPNVFVGGIGILQTPEGSYPQPVQRGDILQVLEPPASIPDEPNYHRWRLMDKDGIQGEIITTTVLDDPAFKELTLLPALDDSGVVSEIAVIQKPPTEQQQPILTLQQPLKYAYDPATVRIAANIVPGTHGETVEEVLGSGDGHLSNQRFALKKPPLTYVPAPNARGSESSLGLRVNGVLWQEVPSLYPLQPYDQNYMIRIQDDGTTIVTFGDGTKGARLPSGVENITATYRSGIGLDGNLKAEQLSLLKTRPLGISEVINPLSAAGGAPRETLTEARINAPATVRTLDRIVSIRDFEDFAQGFAGIGKAQAVPLWSGETQLVHITIAAAQGNEVAKDSNLYTQLVAAIDNARDPIQQVEVDSYERLIFNLEARLLLDPRYEAKVVDEKIRQTLRTTFAFEQRQFAQEVTAAEIIAAIQAIAGVIAVDLDAFYQVGRSQSLERSLPALAARYDAQAGMVRAAQLLRLNLQGIQLTVVPTL